MERRDFYELAEANVRHYMPAEYRDVEFELVEMNKMNDVKMTGLKARMPGWSVKPIVYLDGYYEQYAKSLDGTSAVISLANDMLAAMERVKTNEAAPFMEQSRNLYQSIRDSWKSGFVTRRTTSNSLGSTRTRSSGTSRRRTPSAWRNGKCPALSRTLS